MVLRGCKSLRWLVPGLLQAPGSHESRTLWGSKGKAGLDDVGVWGCGGGGLLGRSPPAEQAAALDRQSGRAAQQRCLGPCGVSWHCPPGCPVDFGMRLGSPGKGWFAAWAVPLGARESHRHAGRCSANLEASGSRGGRLTVTAHCHPLSGPHPQPAHRCSFQ